MSLVGHYLDYNCCKELLRYLTYVLVPHLDNKVPKRVHNIDGQWICVNCTVLQRHTSQSLAVKHKTTLKIPSIYCLAKPISALNR